MLEQIRDELISELETPKSSAAKYEPALTDYFVSKKINPENTTTENLEVAKNNVRSLVNAAHQRAIENLAIELQMPEYQGLTAQEIFDQELLIKEKVIKADFEVPVFKDLEPVQTGTKTVTREIARSGPAVARVWSGIPYTYNVPPVEVIQKALNLI